MNTRFYGYCGLILDNCGRLFVCRAREITSLTETESGVISGGPVHTEMIRGMSKSVILLCLRGIYDSV